jgi:hypothetical protein
MEFTRNNTHTYLLMMKKFDKNIFLIDLLSEFFDQEYQHIATVR